MTTLVRYKGERRGGIASTGATTEETPAELAERLYRDGWEWASITIDEHVVGEVTPASDLYWFRGWWGETPRGEAKRGPS